MMRRIFLQSSLTVTAAAVLDAQAAELIKPAQQLFVSTNTYPWSTFAKREGVRFEMHTDTTLAEIASTGIKGYEPVITQPEEFDGLAQRLKGHGLEMPSIYANSVLHDSAKAKSSIQSVVAIARRAAELGVKTLVTNPSPITWGGTAQKSDAELTSQVSSLNALGAELKKLGITLAYHNHDSEFFKGGREFHHMLTATDPECVKFCLDAHWIYRGCGDSQVALFDVLTHYGNRIVELHLRQSVGGTWTEAFAAQGDIDYHRLAQWLQEHQLCPLLTLKL
jgi:inosose dehydratase